MAGLSWRAVISGRLDGLCEWLVIRENDEWLALEKMPEVTDSKVNGQQFTVKG